MLALIQQSCAVFSPQNEKSESGQQTLQATSELGDETQSEADRNRILSEGYSQLYEAASSLKYLDEALILKFESDAVGNFANDAADYFAQLKGELEQLVKDYPSLSLDDNGLPLLEKKTRSAAQKNRLKSVAPVTGRTGAEFERTLLLTLSGAFNHLRLLALVMQDEEKSEQRKAFLKVVQQNFDRLYDEDIKLLNEEYFCH